MKNSENFRLPLSFEPNITKKCLHLLLGVSHTTHLLLSVHCYVSWVIVHVSSFPQMLGTSSLSASYDFFNSCTAQIFNFCVYKVHILGTNYFLLRQKFLFSDQKEIGRFQLLLNEVNKLKQYKNKLQKNYLQ